MTSKLVDMVTQTVLVTVPGSGFAERRIRARDAWRVRLRAARLDRRLGAGEPPEGSVEMALRAQRLVRPAACRALGRTLLRVLAIAVEPAPASAMQVDGRRVRSAAAELRGLVDRLATGGPVSAYGVARLRALLADGSGPLYHRASPDDLGARLRDVRAALDVLGPAAPGPGTPARPAD
jgi:hypothetical protein